MIDVLRQWLWFSERDGLERLRQLTMKERNDMAAKAQEFANWIALENSREINK